MANFTMSAKIEIVFEIVSGNPNTAIDDAQQFLWNELSNEIELDEIESIQIKEG